MRAVVAALSKRFIPYLVLSRSATIERHAALGKPPKLGFSGVATSLVCCCARCLPPSSTGDRGMVRATPAASAAGSRCGMGAGPRTMQPFRGLRAPIPPLRSWKGGRKGGKLEAEGRLARGTPYAPTVAASAQGRSEVGAPS
ncbi:hypothetical protein NDU88_010922 [Pleurodeles waltl]|uniref:Uncharacterized protein n=1 Tax=Pleurodeles waltl TaxID=8319 RepID=A0AAV7QZJ7_PLEWA|nr:hypothetical protein NDU88_010922 [Pleurodeles waltl]